MIHTRRVLLFFAITSIMLLVLIFTLFFSNGFSPRALYGNGNVTFESKEGAFEVTTTTAEKDLGIRESLIAKLRNRIAQKGELVNEASEESDTKTDEEVKTQTQIGTLLGDGRVGTVPKVGYVFACAQNFNDRGATKAVPWIKDAYWFPTEKIVVDGSIRWQNDVTSTQGEGARIIKTNGLPNHTTGEFPIRAYDDAYAYDTNPNVITSQSLLVQLPVDPLIGASPRCLPLGMIGVGLNGVALFSALDARGEDASAHELHDHCGGHPENTGIYHYHNESECLVNAYYEGTPNTLLGYALDGFGIFSSIENGNTLSNSDLDVCHGHSHQIPWNGSLSTVYHYHMTDEYPYSLGCFMGTPVSASSIPILPNGGLGATTTNM